MIAPQPLQLRTNVTSLPVVTIHGVQCGNVQVSLFLDVFWWFTDGTGALRAFLYGEEVAGANAAQASLSGLEPSDGVFYGYTNSSESSAGSYSPFPAHSDAGGASSSSSVVEAPGGIIPRGDKTSYVTSPPGTLVVYWPHATPTRDGFCLLMFHGSYTAFLVALRAALEIKADGGDYQSALQAATAMVSFMVNNFASWELIASFDNNGTYYIVAK